MTENAEHARRMLTREGVDLTAEESDFLTHVGDWGEAWTIATSTIYATRMMRHALENHARALEEASRASDRYADAAVKAALGLKRATWMLVFVTGLLVIGTLLSVFSR